MRAQSKQINLKKQQPKLDGSSVAFSHPNVQDVQLEPDVGLVLCEDLDAVDVAEISQQGHQVRSGVDYVTDAVTWPNQQRHIGVFLPLLRHV